VSCKPRLVLGLGGELAGDDAIGLHLAAALRPERRLPPDVDVLSGGADLLRAARELAGRSHVVLVDAMEERPGDTGPLVVDHPSAELAQQAGHGHHLDAVQALELLRLAEPGLTRTRFTWFLVPVARIGAGADLSPELVRRVPELCERLLDLLDLRGPASPAPVSDRGDN
jgi:hydrogenase maturation protease